MSKKKHQRHAHKKSRGPEAKHSAELEVEHPPTAHDCWVEGLGVDMAAHRKRAAEDGGRVEQVEAETGRGAAAGRSSEQAGSTMVGVKVQGRAGGREEQVDTDMGKVSRSFMEAEGSAEAGYEYNPSTGAEFAGAKASGKAVVAEVNADTPMGNVSGSFFKAEGSAMAGYEYDPETQVEFAGVKASGSASVFDGKIEGKYGNVSGQLLSASASSKTGVEVDNKTGKIFIGTTNSAEAKVLEAAGTLKTPDGSASLTGDVQVLKASASLDANAVVDKYGIEVNEKVGAEANLVKVEGGGEVRLTPKALYDNTLGWMTGTTAPDVMDFGPVLGAKVSAGEGVGGTVEAGGRLGVDEVNVHGGGFLELAEGVGLDFKAGMRLGPLKEAYDNRDELLQGASDLADKAGQEVDAAEQQVSNVVSTASDYASDAISSVGQTAQNVATVAGQEVDAASQQVSAAGAAVSDFASNTASSAADAVQDLGNAASQTWDSLWDS
jgi:hypothetical protein